MSRERGNDMRERADYRWIDVSPDYRSRLQQFECAEELEEYYPGAATKNHKYYHAYELDVQNTIRNFRSYDTDCQWAQIAVVPDANQDERIIAFVWFGILDGTKTNSDGQYIIGYIARSLETKRCKMGRAALKRALRILRNDYEDSLKRPGGPRLDGITARIDPENKNSIALFKSFGFIDDGQDEDATAFNKYIRYGFPKKLI